MGEESADQEPPGGDEPNNPSFFARLRSRLAKTQNSLVGKMRTAIGLKEKVDEELLEKIEEILLEADVGAATSMKIVDFLRTEGRRREINEAADLTRLVREAIGEILVPGNRPIHWEHPAPAVLLFVGVNGTGKTTTIGKIALELTRAGKKVMLVAADTFRAAAVEQLGVWAERTGACLVSQREGADPASVCFEGIKAAQEGGADVVLIDTAGRLHTKTNLMNELDKIVRVIKKVESQAPHETILVLDATIGQNALSQVKTFADVAPLTGLIMTKLDGTAKGGVMIAIKDAYELPIFKIGIGEAPEDLRDFDPEQFISALFANGD